MKLYKSYIFRNQDPVIAKVHTLVEASGESYAAINRASGVSTSTLRNWFKGETKRPHRQCCCEGVRCGHA